MKWQKTNSAGSQTEREGGSVLECEREGGGAGGEHTPLRGGATNQAAVLGSSSGYFSHRPNFVLNCPEFMKKKQVSGSLLWLTNSLTATKLARSRR